MVYNTEAEIRALPIEKLKLIVTENVMGGGETADIRQQIKGYYDLLSQEELIQKVIELCNGTLVYTPPVTVPKLVQKKRQYQIDNYRITRSKEPVVFTSNTRQLYTGTVTENAVNELFKKNWIDYVSEICDGVIGVKCHERFKGRVRKVLDLMGYKGEVVYG